MNSLICIPDAMYEALEKDDSVTYEWFYDDNEGTVVRWFVNGVEWQAVNGSESL